MGPVTAGGTGPARPRLDSPDPSGEVEEDRDALRPQLSPSHPRTLEGKKRGHAFPANPQRRPPKVTACK